MERRDWERDVAGREKVNHRNELLGCVGERKGRVGEVKGNGVIEEVEIIVG